MKSERYQRIIEENKKFERGSPYNFCDRWCERCVHEKQIRCNLYLDDLERKATCIAHGKDEDDSEITEAILEAQHGELEEKLQATGEKFGIDLDFPGPGYINEEQMIEIEDLPKEIQDHIKFVENHHLPVTVEEYRKRAHEFLKANFYETKNISSETQCHFETVSWYHTLLSAKLQRALAGFHEPVSEQEFGLYDAVAQFLICKKAADESIKALKLLEPHYFRFKQTIADLLALLHNILDRIEAIEESI